MRRSSACCLAESLGWRPRSLPLARATAMPSRVRIRSRSTSNSAKVARMLKKHLAHRIGRVVDLPAEGESDTAGGEVVTDAAGVGH